ncbi:hypothetical protein [Methylobacterium brachiatum]|uniref:hypothetical protein n=1 Tax=Methylobacterium brachiatum TaxID=269660 RepID=UPI0008E94881|nr:hypothetical protein [Methylobacterium brachiatum]SFI68091.1 hypothetical protein SAMN02799642_02531 [Methylobacterium brachiatum]
MTAIKATKPVDTSESLWRDLQNARHDDGAAAREHLQAGFPVYYVEGDTPEGLLVKEYPGGRRELVRFDEAGDQVIRDL